MNGFSPEFFSLSLQSLLSFYLGSGCLLLYCFSSTPSCKIVFSKELGLVQHLGLIICALYGKSGLTGQGSKYLYSLPSMLFSKVFKNSKVHTHCKRASYQCWRLLGNPWPGSEMSQNTVQESLDYKMVDSLLGFGVPQQKEQAASIDSCRSIDSIVFSLVFSSSPPSALVSVPIF